MQTIAVQDAVASLVTHPLFVPHSTPVSANISSTDALLPGVKKTTFEAARLMDEAGYRNIFGITSKVGISTEDITFFQSLKNLRLVILVTYSGMPRKIEPYPPSPRIRGLRLLHEASIPRILYVRPLVEGWNDQPLNMRKIVNLGEAHAQAIVIGGLRVSPEIQAEIERKGVTLPDKYKTFNPKHLSTEIEDRFLEIHSQEKASVPVYRHTSCAVSYLFKRANYNHLFKDTTKNCVANCPSKQQALCGVNLLSDTSGECK